jgi:hypothetical protein
MWVMFWASFL